MSQEEGAVGISIKWESHESERALFANHLTLVFDGSVYTLRFYQALPPTVVDRNNPPTEIVAHHIVTLAISAGDMPSIVDLLQGAKQK